MGEKKVYVINNRYKFREIKKTGIYARVSTARSKQPSSLDTQINGLIDYVEKDPYLRLGDIYIDIGSGRSADSRKGLMRLMEDCRDKEIGQVVTKAVSRFGRNTAETLKLCRELKSMSIDVYFESEHIHSLDPEGELSISLSNAVAEGSSYNLSQSVKWGINQRAQDPDAGIYSRPCYGYAKDSDGNLVIVETEAEVVRTIFHMYLKGESLLKIQKYLEENHIASPTGKPAWPKRTIEKLLRNEKYYGTSILYKTYTDEYPSTKRIENIGQMGKLQVEDHHPAIISKELFDQVQACMQSRKRTPG